MKASDQYKFSYFYFYKTNEKNSTNGSGAVVATIGPGEIGRRGRAGGE